MRARLQAQLHEIRLDLHAQMLRRQEQLAQRRLGELIASRRRDGEREEVARLATELVEERRRIQSFECELAASLDADRSDLGQVSPWIKPVVIARGLCARAVLRHRRADAERALHPRYEATLKAMSFWLPLLAAAGCAYLGERVAAFYRGRERRETV